MKNVLFALILFLCFKSVAQENGDIVHIYCLGHIDGPRYLNGNTTNGTVNLSSATEYPTTGVQWRVERTREGFINLRCMGHIDGIRFLNGNTTNGEVNMSNQVAFPTTGTRWTLVRKSDGNYHIKCEGHIEGVRYLNGNTVKGTVNLSNELTYPTTGTSWRISRANTSNTCPLVPNSAWFTPLRTGFSTAGIRVNNFTSRKHQFNSTGERAYHRPNDCFFRVNLNGIPFRLPFNLDMVEGGPENRCKAYINDWNSNSAIASTSNGRVVIRFNFESAGTELMTDCYNNGCCEGNPFCPAAGCPDYELNRAWIEMYLTPILSGGRLDYTSEVNFNVDVRELGNDPCTNNFWAFLCDWGVIPRVGDRQNAIRRSIENSLRAQLENQNLRNAINTALNNAVRAAGVDLSQCSSVYIDGGGNLIFR